MQLIKSKNANVNYLAKVVEINEFHKHSDPKVEKLKCCYIDGYNIITGIDSEPGLYIYFPTACCINPEFLSYANLYRHGELNRDQAQTGMFEDNGRVKAIRLRGELSEGFIIPVVVFQNWVISTVNIEPRVTVGIEFDTVEHDGKAFWVNKKYIPKNTRTPGQPGSGKKGKGKQPKGLDKLVEDQFRFHYDTILIKKCPNVLHPEDLISISEKVHGTSGISAYVLCKRPKKWYEKVFEFLTRKEIDNTKYDYLYSSRSVVKNQYYNRNAGAGFYGVDVWKLADDIVRPALSKGMTAYYEIIGFLPTGGYIQKDYDYGCVPPSTTNKFPAGADRKYYIANSDGSHTLYKEGVHFKVRIYRLTLTNVDGVVHEFSGREVQQWCKLHNLVPVEEYYYGTAGNLYKDIDPAEHWNENFLARLANDANFHMECNSPTCNNKVPHEGVVIRIENMKSEAFKLKCFKFLDKEGKALDKGETNIEDNA
jgi:hypothetical protein|nr:MAG TPA: Naegleria gruberi RNA ligase repair, adenylyltransferase, LIGASE [Caudoviricetes sp.]